MLFLHKGLSTRQAPWPPEGPPGYLVGLISLARVATLSGALSLMTESILFGTMSSHGGALSLMVIGSLAAPLMVLWIFPEPSGRVLEEISPEK